MTQILENTMSNGVQDIAKQRYIATIYKHNNERDTLKRIQNYGDNTNEITTAIKQTGASIIQLPVLGVVIINATKEQIDKIKSIPGIIRITENFEITTNE